MLFPLKHLHDPLGVPFHVRVDEDHRVIVTLNGKLEQVIPRALDEGIVGHEDWMQEDPHLLRNPHGVHEAVDVPNVKLASVCRSGDQDFH
jgi:hypothetical protein